MIGIEKMASIGRRYAPSNAWVGENNPIAKRKNAISSKPLVNFFLEILHGKPMILE